MASAAETVLVTGASSGIGEELAKVFAEHGHDLILVARSEDKLEKLADELAAEHNVAVSVRPMDLSKKGSASRLARGLEREGYPVDVLVNNAGVLQHGAFVDMSPADHQRIVQLNVAGLTDMLAHFLPTMVERGSGRVLNVASIASFMPVPSLATYAATKAYVLSLGEALAEELRGSGVTVTTLCPGVTDTHMMDEAMAGSEKLKLPGLMVGDPAAVAREGFRACMKGETIVVPGTINQALTLTARTTPKWLLQRLTGLMGRSTL
jgi:short-subunit dehydrogenase